MQETQKKKIEAVLFAVGDRIEEQKLASHVNLDLNTTRNLLKQLKKDYEQKNSAFILSNQANTWKLTVGEKYMDTVLNIMPHTELSRAIMSSLAVIAWKAPVLQSDVVDIRGNKCYSHIKELVEMGYITKKPHGRSYMIKLAQRFYEYFDLNGKQEVKEKFANFEELSEDDLIIENLEKQGIEPYDEKLGNLEVYEEKEENQIQPASETQTQIKVVNEDKEEPHISIVDIPEEEASSEEDKETDDNEEKDNEQEDEGEQEKKQEDLDDESNDQNNTSDQNNSKKSKPDKESENLKD